jgi:hypothetical protein
MPETLDERLAKIERGEKEVLKVFAGIIKAGDDMHTSDFLLLGILKRTLAHADGFRDHITKRNFICAGTILRAQFDTALRANAISLVKQPEQFASEVLGGAHINKMKDRDGKKMTDAYLAEKLGETHPWVQQVYNTLAELGHFSRRHIFSSIAKTNDAERIVHFQISAKDPPRPDDDYFEIVECFYETMRTTCEIAAGWHTALRRFHAEHNKAS